MPPRRALTPRGPAPPRPARRRAPRARAARLKTSKIIYKIHGTRDFVASIVARVLESPASARDLKLKRLRASRGFARRPFARRSRRRARHHSAFTLARPLRAPFNPLSANPSCASTLARDARPGQCLRRARAENLSRRVASRRRRRARSRTIASTHLALDRADVLIDLAAAQLQDEGFVARALAAAERRGAAVVVPARDVATEEAGIDERVVLGGGHGGHGDSDETEARSADARRDGDGAREGRGGTRSRSEGAKERRSEGAKERCDRQLRAINGGA